MYTQLRPYLHTHPAHHNSELAPLASPVESRAKGSSSTYSARPANSVASASSSPREESFSTSVQVGCDGTSKSMSTSTPPKLLHLQHDFLDTWALMPLRHGRKSPESADGTYHHRKCRACAVRAASGAQRVETASPYALYYLLCCHHRRNFFPLIVQSNLDSLNELR